MYTTHELVIKKTDSGPTTKDIPATWASQPSGNLGSVFFGVQAQDGFEGMFGGLYSSSSFYSSLPAEILLPAPISAPIAIHQKPTVDLPAALLTDRARSDLFGFLDDAELAQVSVGKTPLNTSYYGLHSQTEEFESFLASSTASGLGSTSADTPTSAICPADNVKQEPTSSRKRTRKDAAPPTKHIKLAENGGERPFACGQCEKRFSRNSDLKRHVKLHTGERPHKCPVCSRAFARADALSRHTEKGETCKWAANVLARIVGQTLPLPHKTPSRLFNKVTSRSKILHKK
ncbi:hypothetical protein GGI09_000535 [Coemansia sp. S100]|nr:hypothetical protein GGI09_000535 [Coemansia sp. S100]